MDSARPRGEDLSTTKHSTKYLHLLQQGYYDIVAISPPCATFPRATWATRRGPRPIRSLAEPRGLAKLTAKERDPTFSRIFLFRWLGLPLTQLHSSGPHQGHRPATMWQWPQRSVCFHQSSLGAGYHKPTRVRRPGLLHGSWLSPHRRLHSTWWPPRLPISGRPTWPTG